jgi:hypothetical protein
MIPKWPAAFAQIIEAGATMLRLQRVCRILLELVWHTATATVAVIGPMIQRRCMVNHFVGFGLADQLRSNQNVAGSLGMRTARGLELRLRRLRRLRVKIPQEAFRWKARLMPRTRI